MGITKPQKNLLAITMVTSAVAMILPSVVTQVNWLYNEQGLAPMAVRKKVLVGSWIASGLLIVGAFVMVKNLNGDSKVGKLGYNK